MRLHNTYYLMRHGQTPYQADKKDWVYPPSSKKIPLTKKGVVQVEKSAQELKNKNIDLIFASDLFRTKETAGIVTKEIGQKIIFDSRLRDINLGIWHGKKKEDFFKEFPKFSRKLFYKRPEGGENWPDCKKRMISFFRELEKKYRGKTILIVSHGDPIWLLEGWVKGYSVDFLATHKKELFLKTGSFKRL